MSEDIIKENNDGKTTEAAVSSTEAALSEIKLHSAPKMRNSEKDMSALKAANDKKFAALKAKMAENMRVAEENGEQRIEELRAERARAMADDPKSTANKSVEASCSSNAEKVAEKPPVPGACEEKKDESDKCVIDIGERSGTEKYILSIVSPGMPYFVPYPPVGYPPVPPKAPVPPPNQVPVPVDVRVPSEQPSDQGTELPDPIEDAVEREELYSEYPDPIPELYPVSDEAPSPDHAPSEFDHSTVAAVDEYHMMQEQKELYDPKTEEMDLFSRAQLNKSIGAFYKEERAYLRKIQRIEAKQADADNEENIALAVEKIALQKELCELSIEVLSACVYVSVKGKTARHKRVLRIHIDKYNLYCDEYEKLTGRPLHRLDYGIIDDVLAGKISQPIPNVYYYGAEGGASDGHDDIEADRLHREENEYAALSREYERYLEDGGAVELTAAERTRENKKSTARISAIRRATERDILLVALRNEYRLDALEARRDILMNSYGSDRGKVMKELRSIERTMSRVRAASRRSIPIEREDNTRFYLLSALDAETEKVKAGARRDRLASLRQRLDFLLAERESINERLIVLYGGSDKKLKKAKVNRKAATVRRKAAKKAFKKQSDIARHIERFNVSRDMKERAYAVLNQKTAAVARAEEIRYKLRHLKPRGRARAELYSQLSRAKKDVKRANAEIKYMMKRLKKIQDRHSDRREFAVLFMLLAIFLLCVGIVWFAFGDSILSYFKELWSKLRGL